MHNLCCTEQLWQAAAAAIGDNRCQALDPLPLHCSLCGRILRPVEAPTSVTSKQVIAGIAVGNAALGQLQQLPLAVDHVPCTASAARGINGLHVITSCTLDNLQVPNKQGRPWHCPVATVCSHLWAAQGN